MPDLVEVVQLALDVDEAVGEGVGGGIEVAVGLDEAALGEDLAGRVFDGEVDPGFVEVALLGNERVGDALVLNDDVGDEGFAGGERESCVRPRGAMRAFARQRMASRFFLQGEDVDVEDAVAVGAISEEFGELLGLLVEFVVGGNERVAAEPAMRDEGAVFGAGVLSIRRRVARAACGRSGRWRRCLCGRREAATAW